MKVLNCNYYELIEILKNETIIIFGIGEYFKLHVIEMLTEDISKNVKYLIDNNIVSEKIIVGCRRLSVFSPSILKGEKECTVLIASSNHMYDMYQQLEAMELGDGIKIGSIPLIMANSIGKTDKNLEWEIFNKEKQKKIKKTIHSFWFSGEPKPDLYKKCVDSWKVHCQDYEIIEWNMENYDYTKNAFMRQAIERKKWAFASDYARLDIIYHLGGIYLDMDVELLGDLDSLLGNNAFFTFDTQNNIDLGTFGADAGNSLISKMIKLYDNAEFSEDMETMNFYCQPRFIRSTMEEYGVVLNGDTQYLDGMAFLARNFLSPKDYFVYRINDKAEGILGVHHFNVGWKNSDYRCQRIKNNRKLMKYMESRI